MDKEYGQQEKRIVIKKLRYPCKRIAELFYGWNDVRKRSCAEVEASALKVSVK